MPGVCRYRQSAGSVTYGSEYCSPHSARAPRRSPRVIRKLTFTDNNSEQRLLPSRLNNPSFFSNIARAIVTSTIPRTQLRCTTTLCTRRSNTHSTTQHKSPIHQVHSVNFHIRRSSSGNLGVTLAMDQQIEHLINKTWGKDPPNTDTQPL